MTALCKNKFCYFGDNAEFRPGAYAICCSQIRIGKRVVVRPGSFLAAVDDGGITIEDDVLLGQGVHIYVNNHRFNDPHIPIIDQGHQASAPVVIKKGAWVGANSIVLPGVTIGENTVVGAGSVVTRSLPEKVVAIGSPAKVIRRIGE